MNVEEGTAVLAEIGTVLADAIDEALPRWVERVITERAEVSVAELGRARSAVAATATEVRRLLATDLDQQWTNPLHLLRAAVAVPTAVLVAAGVPPASRDRDAERLFPDDIFDLTPGSFAEVDPALHEPGLMWGAAKAHVHLTRRRRDGDPASGAEAS